MAYKSWNTWTTQPEGVVLSFGVKVFDDPKSLAYLDDTELDYAHAKA